MLKVGIVGARGLSTLEGFKGNPNAEVVALCDLNEELLKAEAKKHGIQHTFRIYEDMLESDIDAVVVATPMQMHIQQSLAALEAGKHVMSEVTAGVSLPELFWLADAVEKSGRTYFFAENYSYIPENQMIKNMAEQGVFGEIYFAEGEYLHDIRNLTTYPDGKTSWRKYWQLGRRGTFYPTHSLGPVMQWLKGEKIAEISCHGTGWHTDPELLQEDTAICLCKTNSGKLIKIRVDCISDRPHNMTYYSLQGTKGCYEAPRGLGDQHKIWIRGERAGDAWWEPLEKYKEQYMPERYLFATEEQRKTGHWGGDYFIVEDFVNAALGKTKPEIDVYDACEWTAVALLSELSVMNNGMTIKMPDFRVKDRSKKYLDLIGEL